MQNYLKHSLLLFCLLLGMAATAVAQVTTLKGVVTDKSGNPLPGVTVMETGTSNGTATDDNGAFTLRVASPDTPISVSSIGYSTIETTAKELGSKVVLREDTEYLDDVVVIGYGTVKKEDLTGSITAVKAEEINRGAVYNSYELLKGKVPGLLVLPGGTLRIRGISSLNASNDPLIVVDGIPLSSNGLSTINPEDVESFSVLKDASSAAIYGSRAASGVIMITTKKAAASRKPHISYSGSFSLSHYMGREDVMDADEYRQFMRELYADRPGSLEVVESLMGDEDTDWIGMVTRVGQASTHNLSITGTTLKGHLPYCASVAYFQTNGQTIGSWWQAPRVNVTLSPTFLDNHLSITLNARANTSFSSPASASYGSAASFDPTQPVHFYNEDGSIDYDTNYGYYIASTGRGDDLVPAAGAANNPMQYDNNIVKTRNFGWNLSSIINYKVHGLEDLVFNLRLSTDRRDNYYKSRPKPKYWGLISDGIAPRIGTNNKSTSFNLNDMLEFFAGYSWEHFYYMNHNTTRYNDDYTDSKGVQHLKDEIYGTNIPHGEEHYLVSYYGRINYSYKSRYLATFTLRDDGSSRFAKENRWGLFPSVAAAWNIKQEPFMKSADFLDELKLRLGWGVTGQESGIANYSYIANYSLSTSVTSKYSLGSDGRFFELTPAAYDPNIKWEETTTTNVGLDFGFLHGKVNGNIDLYKRETKDLLNSVFIQMGANFSNNLLTNIGSMENKGIELGVTWNALNKRDLSLMVAANATYQDTKFTKLTVGDQSANEDYFIQVGRITGGTGGYLQQQRVGYAPRTFYLYQQAYDSKGNPIQNSFIDRDGDGKITDNDRYLTDKNPLPKFFYGLNVKATWKRWDFGFNAHGSAKNWVFWDYHQANSTPANDWVNYSHIYNYRNIVKKTGWTKTSNTAQGYSDYFLYDASFFKIDDVNIGYNFMDVFGIKANMRVSLSVNNVVLITDYPGVDPEIGDSGIDGNGTPRSRTYSLRLNVNF